MAFYAILILPCGGIVTDEELNLLILVIHPNCYLCQTSFSCFMNLFCRVFLRNLVAFSYNFPISWVSLGRQTFRLPEFCLPTKQNTWKSFMRAELSQQIEFWLCVFFVCPFVYKGFGLSQMSTGWERHSKKTASVHALPFFLLFKT